MMMSNRFWIPMFAAFSSCAGTALKQESYWWFGFFVAFTLISIVNIVINHHYRIG